MIKEKQLLSLQSSQQALQGKKKKTETYQNASILQKSVKHEKKIDEFELKHGTTTTKMLVSNK